MDCQEVRDLLGAYADNELGLADAARLNRHLQACAACRAELASLRALGRALRAEGAYHRAPQALRARIAATLALPPAAAQPPAPRGWAGLAGGRGLAAWSQAATALIAAGALALAAALWLQRPAAPEPYAQEIVASHVRALLSGHPIDVVSTDQHTVKPWFNGRLDYAPPVLDLSAQGFPLAGGRVDYVGGRQVAVLTYHYRKHPIDLYVLPAGAAGASAPTQPLEGYALASWQAGSMRCWAITDAAPEALQAFEQAWRAQWRE